MSDRVTAIFPACWIIAWGPSAGAVRALQQVLFCQHELLWKENDQWDPTEQAPELTGKGKQSPAITMSFVRR